MLRGKVDLVLAIVVIALIMVGQVMVFSASSISADFKYGSVFYFFAKQITYGFLAVTLCIAVSHIDYRKFNKGRRASFFIVFAIVLLVGLLIVGRPIKGAVRWYDLGITNFQPSEVARLAVIIFLAHRLSNTEVDFSQFKKEVLPIIMMPVIIIGLIVLQPDLSTALMICLVCAGMFFVSRVPQRYLAYMASPAIPLGILLMNSGNYQVRRIEAWLASLTNIREAPYQVKQSAIALGRGGLWGQGIGESKQKLNFLPDSHTDFIFSIIGEEFGFIGASIILIAFVIVLVRGLRIARNAPDGFGQFLALGITLNIALYAFMNTAVVTNLVPATGLPMPFISYGGSHLLFMGIAVGVLLNISRHVRHGGEELDWSEFQNRRQSLHNRFMEVD